MQNPDDAKQQGNRRKLYKLFDIVIGFDVDHQGKFTPVYTMLVVVEDYTGDVVTSYPDITYPHRGPNYRKKCVWSFKGRPL